MAFEDDTIRNLIVSDNIFVRIKNVHGSTEHYYHYLLGYLFPLINWYYFDRPEWTKNKNIIIKSCGAAMDPHTNSLNLSNVCIVNELIHKKAFRKAEHKIEIKGYDWPNGYEVNKNQILRAKNFLLEKAKDGISSTGIDIPLMINRGAEPVAYHKNAKGSASSRRSIPNFSNLIEILKHKTPRVEYLENATLLDQIIMFNTHSVVIGQHGAALSNIVFCKKDTIVIEIGPTLNCSGKFGYFENLCPIIQAKLFRCPQEHNHHFPINLDAFVTTLKEAKII